MKLNDLDLNKLVIFSVVAQYGGYREASEELNITRSAISQAITNLENSLGKKLFNRVGSKLRLTQPATTLFHQIRQNHQQLQNALSQFTQKNASVSGQLRIGAYLEFTKSKLMPVIEEFMNSHPNAQMKFVFDSPSRLNTLLAKDRIDISISVFPHQNTKFIESKPLYQEELVLISHKDLLSTHATRDQILQTQIIDYFPSHILFKRWWHNQFNRHLKSVPILTYASTAEMVMELVSRRLGIGVIPRYVFDLNIRNDKIHIIQPTDKKLLDYVWLSQFKQKNREPIHYEFLILLNKRFKIG